MQCSRVFNKRSGYRTNSFCRQITAMFRVRFSIALFSFGTLQCKNVMVCVTSLFAQQYIGNKWRKNNHVLEMTLHLIIMTTKLTKSIYLVHNKSIISLMSSRLNSAAYFLYVGCTALLPVDRLCHLEQHFYCIPMDVSTLCSDIYINTRCVIDMNTGSPQWTMHIILLILH